MNDVVVTGITTASATNSYTMQMWVYIHSFIGSNFSEFEVQWNRHNRIKIVELSEGVIIYQCYPRFEEGNPSYDATLETLGFQLNKWMFISCATNIDDLRYAVETESVKLKGTFSGVSPNLAAPATTTLKIFDRSTVGLLLISLRSLICTTT